MIFFIVKNADPLDMKKIKYDIMENKSEKLTPNDAVLISWNEVFENLAELKRALQYAVSKDAHCLNMLSQAKKLYGMDFSEDGEKTTEIKAIIDNHLFYWAHPLIGNIANSPNLRPHDISQQYRLNWNLLEKYKGPQTLAKIDELFNTYRIDRSGRDQVRICHNIYELARAFYGEVTSCASRRLEKLLALKLCQSAGLYENQRNMLTEFYNKHIKSLKDNISNGRFHMEYCSYYFNGIDWKSNNEKCADRVDELICLTINKDYEWRGLLSKECLEVWNKLPPTIRCAILINDLRKCFGNVGEPERMSMTCDSNFGSYRPSKAAGKDFLPVLGFNGGRFLWSWNRDENHPATQTYRYYLCPLWAGPSGHTGGSLKFWKKMLGDAFDKNGYAITVASSFFIFWRLYFDKRISANHTLTETFEATWCKEITGAFNGNITPDPNQHNNLPPEGDAFQFISYQANLFNRPSVDPITLFMHLRKVYFRVTDDSMKAYKNLKALIDEERVNVFNAGYWLPQWSRELSQKQGQNVQSFAETFSGKLSGVFTGFRLLDKKTKDIIMSYIIRK